MIAGFMDKVKQAAGEGADELVTLLADLEQQIAEAQVEADTAEDEAGDAAEGDPGASSE